MVSNNNGYLYGFNNNVKSVCLFKTFKIRQALPLWLVCIIHTGHAILLGSNADVYTMVESFGLDQEGACCRANAQVDGFASREKSIEGGSGEQPGSILSFLSSLCPWLSCSHTPDHRAMTPNLIKTSPVLLIVQRVCACSSSFSCASTPFPLQSNGYSPPLGTMGGQRGWSWHTEVGKQWHNAA